MHILAMNAVNSQSQQGVIKRIFNTLKQRGVDCICEDNTGSNALHYAVKCNAYELVELLIAEGISVNQINSEGHSPLSINLGNKRLTSLNVSNLPFKPIW